MQGTLLLDRYEVMEQLGAGGMGIVYRAVDRQSGSAVAAKIIGSGGNEAQEHRLRREYRALQRVRHPNVVQVMAWGTHEGRFFYVMELVRGVTLKDYVKSPDPAMGASAREPVDRFLHVIITVLSALDAVHAAGIVHRDIKPQNIMVDERGVVKLMDFGLVQGADVSMTESTTGSMLGTIGYMAPEQVHGHRVDHRADLYSIGVVLYEFLTGRRPFVGDNAITVLTRILNERPTPPRLLCGWIGLALEDIVLRLLGKKPEDRFASAVQLAEALRRVAVAGAWIDPAEQSWSSGAVPPPSAAGRLVGRDDVMEKLRGACDRSLRGRGQLVLVAGEAGIGKSRLVQELQSLLVGADLALLRGACYENEGIFYQPFLAALSEHRRLAGIESSPRARVSLEAALRASFREVDPEQGQETAEVEESRAASGGKIDLAEQMKLFDLAARLFGRLSRRRPLVLVVEDLQWADELTLELARFLARNLKSERFLLLLSYRSDDRVTAGEGGGLATFLTAVQREALVDLDLRLARLDRDATGDLAAALLERESLPDALREAIHRHSDGNPYFVVEIARAVAEALQSGTLPAPRGVFDIPLPKSASDLVERQLSRVSEEGRKLLTLAALVGREFTFDVLKSLSGLGEDPLLDLLDGLIRVGIIEEVPTRDLDTYRFAHAITRAVLEREVNRRKARRIHSAIAQAMEDIYHDRLEDRIEEVVEEIARHAFLAREHNKALLYALAAGQKAANAYAHETAIRYLEMAHEVYCEAPALLSPEQATALTLHLGEAYERTGRLSQAKEICEELLGSLGKAEHPLLAADLLYALAGVHESLGSFTTSLEHLDQAQELARSDEERSSAIMRRRGDIWNQRGDGAAALELYLAVLAGAEEKGRGEEVLSCMERIARVFLQNGEPREARKYLERAIEQARAMGDDARLAQLLAAEGQAQHDLFDGKGEIASLEECLQVRKRLGDQLGTVEPMGRLGRAFVRQGDLVKGMSYLEESLRRAKRYGLLAQEALRLRDLATVCTYRGEPEAAGAHLSQALDIAQRLRHAPSLFAVTADLARSRAELGKHDEARVAAEAARSLALEKRNVFWLLRAEVVRAEVLYAAVGERPQVRAEADLALGEAERVASGLGELLPSPHFAPLRLLKARALQLHGDHAAALKEAEAALGSLADAELPALRAKALLATSGLYAHAGDATRAGALLSEARAIYQKLGSRAHLDRLESETGLFLGNERGDATLD